jgi:hypothetical protein
MRTKKFVSIMGVNASYFHNNEADNDKSIYRVWQKIAKEYYDENDVYISANINKVKTIYNEEWGCPVGGEDTYEISGVCNPEFTEYSNWESAVHYIVKRDKDFYKQSTCTLEFIDCDLYYFK